MPESFTRRELFRRALVAGGVALGVGGGTEAFAFREFAPYHQINDQKRAELQITAESLVAGGLVKVGDFSPIEVTSPTGEVKKKPILHAEGVAETLLYMSYMDGGQDSVNHMVNFIHRHGGLAVEQLAGNAIDGNYGETNVVGAAQFIDSALAAFHVSLDPHLTVKINPAAFLNRSGDPTLAHELYHVNQQGRDGEVGSVVEKAFVSGVESILFLSTFYLINKGANKGRKKVRDFLDRKMPRRQLLKSLTAFPVLGTILLSGSFSGLFAGDITAELYKAWFSPYERQAYTQGGTKNQLGALTSQEPIKSAVKSIVTFEDVD